MASKDTGKGARIGLACNACRSKKHRCSGAKPICAQCASTNITCTWPTQQKRGPPKHYMNSLEARLFETETVLLSLLSHVSTEQLKASFQSMPPTGRTHHDPNYEGEQDTEQLAVVKQYFFRPAYWSLFPLDSAENVHRWWKDRTSQASGGQSQNDIAPDLALREILGPDARPSGFHEPGDLILDDSGPLPHSNYTEQTELDLTRGTASNYLNANVQPETSSVRSEDELSTTNTEFSENLLARSGNRDSIMQMPDQFKQDFLW